MNRIQVAGMVRNISFSHEIKGVKMYEGILSVERHSGTIDLMIFQTWEENIEPGEFYSIEGELKTIRTDGYPKKKTYIKVTGIKHILMPIYCNKVSLIGTVKDKSPTRVTPLGKTICDFVLKVESEHSVAYISTIAWGILAKQLEQIPEGTPIRIDGRLQKRYYHRANSCKTYGVYEISAYKILREGEDGYLQVEDI